jgi:hypothetical protein
MVVDLHGGQRACAADDLAIIPGTPHEAHSPVDTELIKAFAPRLEDMFTGGEPCIRRV